MDVKTFIPSNMNLIICGYKVEGWNKVVVTRNSPTFRQIRGIRGKNTRVRLEDSSAVISITVPQSEDVNDVLSLIALADIQYGTCRLEVMLKDITSDTIFTTTNGYLTMLPPISYSSEVEDNTWEIYCDESMFVQGGSKSASAGIVEGSVSRLKDFVSDITGI